MDRRILFPVLLIFLVSLGSAQIYYDVDVSDDRILMNNTIRLECDPVNCPVSRWTLTLEKPEQGSIIGVESLQGEESEYNIIDDKISVETFMSEPKDTETILVMYRINRSPEEVHNGLYTTEISLSGFSGETNSGTITVDNLVSGTITDGFQNSVENDTFKFQGEGPGNADVNSGEGYETEYFEFFGGRPSDTEEAYQVAVGTLGFSHRLRRIPVALMPSGKYNRTVNTWSAGQYLEGYIVMRDNLDEDFNPILAHEVVHALNDQRITWDDTSSRWLDEGVGKYIEFLMQRKEKGEERTREIFGEEVSYIESENGNRYRYTIPPKGDKEKLWQYYSEDMQFMKQWNSDSAERSFGYAYSELIIRNYVARMNGSISELYREIGSDNRLETNQEKWEYYSKFMDLTPCKYESRERFERCLETINSYDYPVYIAESLNRTKHEMRVEKIEVPNRTGKGHSFINDSGTRKTGRRSVTEQIRIVLGRIVSDISEFFN